MKADGPGASCERVTYRVMDDKVPGCAVSGYGRWMELERDRVVAGRAWPRWFHPISTDETMKQAEEFCRFFSLFFLCSPLQLSDGTLQQETGCVTLTFTLHFYLRESALHCTCIPLQAASRSLSPSLTVTTDNRAVSALPWFPSRGCCLAYTRFWAPSSSLPPSSPDLPASLHLHHPRSLPRGTVNRFLFWQTHHPILRLNRTRARLGSDYYLANPDILILDV
jgi:hypothetical protein